MSATAVHSLWTTAGEVTSAAPGDRFTAPTIEYAQLAPVLIVVGVAVLGVLVEAFVPRRARYTTQVFLTVVALAASFAAVIGLAADGYATKSAHIAAMGAIAVDGPALFLQGTILLVSMVSVFTFAERRLEPAPHGDGVSPAGTKSRAWGRVDSFAAQAGSVPGSDSEKAAVKAGFTTTEVFPLLLFSVAGMLVFPAANDLLTLFIALEVFSLPLYLLCAVARRKRLMSQEAAVKYFLLGSFSSAFLLFGIALLYGYAGTVSYAGIAGVVDGDIQDIDPALADTMGNDALLLIGGAMILMGLFFKVGAVPFHMWTPDVYQGAPTPVTGFMAAATKVAAFGALLRLLYVVLPGLTWDLRPVMWGVAIVTMVGGAVVAITQTDIKRLLAYSSIAHAGFILAGVIAASPDGISSVLFYLGVYSFVTVGAFAVVTLVRDAGGEATHLSKWAGLGRRSPLTAAVFAVFLLSFAGIPLTSGFSGKFAVFKAAADGGAAPLVVVGVISSAIAAFFYIRVIVLMFFSEPKADGPTVAVPSPLTMTTIAVGVAVTLVLGLAPQYFLDLASQAGGFVR
ncbi:MULTISPECIES: NADH-quinone oxidoreductase subunit NuoN [unclassified Streptomyces]|uniref:NADH-quinone oxidoreductase subunit NuoN n=1 Tax=Streptomyces TaxID=1883 RepID=UPI0001C197D4|nr:MULTISPECIES: NADH-quinone oxidoreductase subunit NuoN [unclassified Streptomyces]AEN11734.1 proton-translocating NADH-quinone oxidoreductase, chain N [Streptomyces sp. SirexAA-E]PZX40269.1 proton-translocating NADH-quinone oxidoreductase chain N [Streptomyces sp. DvalAA-21]RAJ36436.1 proton-translocating NADH-quinone oxidoreductase chain N [Streptomyces sp. DpondAA-E10]RAJ50402.1 proton-translocating NADH-quinone oxidoreductase chain N [Streptomyces sp. DpondAA-A50]SCD48613.1 NADH-quinone 